MNADYNEILSRFRKAAGRYLLFGLAEAVFSAVAVALLLFTFIGSAESFFYFAPAIKTPLFFTAAVSFFIVLTVIIVLRIGVYRPNRDDIARMIERRFPQFGDRLISAVQLGALRDDELRGQSRELIDALVSRMAGEIRTVDVTDAVSSRRVVFAGRSAAILLILFFAFSLVLPGPFIGGVVRLADFSSVYYAPGSASIHMFKTSRTIIRGEDFTARGILSGWNAEPLTFFYRWDDSREWNSRTVDVESQTGVFTAMVEKPRRSFSYYLESGKSSTAPAAVDVLERPDIETIEYTLDYPRYTGLGTVTGSGGDGSIRALVGTDARVKVTANKPLAEMTVFWSDSTETSCTIDTVSGEFSFRIMKTLDYHIGIVDTSGIHNANPIMYRVTCLTDEPPSVVIASPPPDITLPLSMKFPLVYRAADDYGLSSVVLSYKVSFNEAEKKIALKKGAAGRQIEDTYLWDLSGFNLLPDDTVSYYLEVYDNDTVNGPKKGVSGTGILRIPSMSDFYSEVMEEQEKGIDRLKDMTAKKLETKDLKEVEKSILNGEKLDWSDSNALEETKRNMESMQRDLKEMSEDIKRAAERLSEEDMAAVETLEKYQTIAKLMDEIADGDMKEAIKRMTQVNLQVDPRLLKDALEKHQVSADEIKKKLDRLISMLEQVKSIQRFDIARRLVEEMAAKQADLAAEYEKNPDNKELVREQERLAAEMQSLEKELAEAMKELSEQFGMQTEGFEEYLDSLDISGSMQKASESMKNDQKARTSAEQKKANAGLSDLMSKLDETSDAMMNSNSEEMQRRLFAALTDLLAVSGLQENVAALSNGADQDAGIDPAKRELEVIDALNRAKKSLAAFTELSLDIAGILDHMTNAMDESMTNAVDAFAMGDMNKGRAESRTALATMNRAVHLLTMMTGGDQQGSQSMPGDLMKQLQQIANGQMSLQMQMQGEGAEQLMMQLAAEQQKLAEMLSELGRKMQDDPRLRQMLEKLSEDMDDTSRMMRRNEKRELVERRQADIYRRLLDARRSRREKDQNEERKSWTAKRNESKGADSLAGDLGEKKREINRRIDQAMKDDFDPAYLQLIRRYFESMLKDYEQPAAGTSSEGAAR